MYYYFLSSVSLLKNTPPFTLRAKNVQFLKNAIKILPIHIFFTFNALNHLINFSPDHNNLIYIYFSNNFNLLRPFCKYKPTFFRWVKHKIWNIFHIPSANWNFLCGGITPLDMSIIDNNIDLNASLFFEQCEFIKKYATFYPSCKKCSVPKQCYKNITH